MGAGSSAKGPRRSSSLGPAAATKGRDEAAALGCFPPSTLDGLLRGYSCYHFLSHPGSVVACSEDAGSCCAGFSRMGRNLALRKPSDLGRGCPQCGLAPRGFIGWARSPIRRMCRCRCHGRVAGLVGRQSASGRDARPRQRRGRSFGQATPAGRRLSRTCS